MKDSGPWIPWQVRMQAWMHLPAITAAQTMSHRNGGRVVRRLGVGLHTGFQGCAAQAGLAGHAQDGVGFVWVLLEFLVSFYCRQDEGLILRHLAFASPHSSRQEVGFASRPADAPR